MSTAAALITPAAGFPGTRPTPRRQRPAPAAPRAPEAAAGALPAEHPEVPGVAVEAVEGGHRITHLATRYRAFHAADSRFNVLTVARNLKRTLDKLGAGRGAGLPTYAERPLGAAMPEGWNWDERVRRLPPEEARPARRRSKEKARR